MTRIEAADLYARALGDLISAKVKLAAQPSRWDECDAGRAEREIAEAILVLTDAAGEIREFLDAPLRSVEGPARDRL